MQNFKTIEFNLINPITPEETVLSQQVATLKNSKMSSRFDALSENVKSWCQQAFNQVSTERELVSLIDSTFSGRAISVKSKKSEESYTFVGYPKIADAIVEQYNAQKVVH